MNKYLNMYKMKYSLNFYEHESKKKRTVPLTTKLNPEIHDELRKIAYQKKCKLVDVIEEGIELVKKNSEKK